MNEQETDWVDAIGAPAYAGIVEMVRALEVDWDRLERLRDDRDSYDHGPEAWAEEYPDDAEELADLATAAGESASESDARERISEDPLSVEVRSGWTTPGEPLEPEYCLLLTTGGPAVRIRGNLDSYGEPDSARLEVQDWGEPWTEYLGADSDTLLAYARCFCFYFGE